VLPAEAAPGKAAPKALLRLEPLAAGLRPIGEVGARRAERGQWRLDAERWIVLYRLRGWPASGHLLFESLSARGTPKSLSIGEALQLMDEAGLLRPESAEEFGFPVSSMKQAAPSWTSALCWGRTLIPGPSVSARLSYSRAQVMLGGRIYSTPYAAGADENALRRAKGLLTTQGGPQSAMLAAAAGVPAVELPQAEWTESAGLRVEEPVFGAPRKVSGAQVRDLVGVRRILIREGDAVRLEADEGLVGFTGPDKLKEAGF